MRSLFTLLFLVTINLFGQNPKDKSFSNILGAWKFGPTYITLEDGKKAILDSWLVMHMTFSSQGVYKFVLYDSVIEEGKWNISENGKTLLLSERKQIPEYHEKLQPLSFPIKLKGGKYLKISVKGFEKGVKTKDYEVKFVPVN